MLKYLKHSNSDKRLNLRAKTQKLLDKTCLLLYALYIP